VKLPRYVVLGILVVLCGAAVVRAQIAMPDPKQMSGIPRPVSDLPAGSISVRLIRGSLSNNIPDHPVELHVGSKVQTAKTDASGRAQFDKVPTDQTLKATADVDGEHLESQEFRALTNGGIRLMLVATDKNAPPATEPNAPAVGGQVVITNQSRIVIEPGEEVVNVFFLFDIENTARVPVNPPVPFAFDLPAEAVGTGIMQGSTPLASINGHRIEVKSPFPPGHTFLQAGTSLPVPAGAIDLAVTLPANLESLAVVVQKTGGAVLNSPQLTSVREMPAEGQIFIAGTGGAVKAGQPILLSLEGLPHHSRAPRIITLMLAVGIVLAGVFSSTSSNTEQAGRATERKRLVARREKLMQELVRLEADHRAGRGDARRYASRRQELLAALEHVYGALDDDPSEAADRALTAPRTPAVNASRA
jgi:hypothetical protein